MAPKDGLPKESSDPQPEDVRNLERSQGDVKTLADQNAGWSLGQTVSCGILSTPYLHQQDDHSPNDAHQLPHQP